MLDEWEVYLYTIIPSLSPIFWDLESTINSPLAPQTLEISFTRGSPSLLGGWDSLRTELKISPGWLLMEPPSNESGEPTPSLDMKWLDLRNNRSKVQDDLKLPDDNEEAPK